jgi:hypothetical protein
MTKIISASTLIREMCPTELLDYVTNIWENDYQQNTVEFLNNEGPTMLRCFKAYRQLTDRPIVFDISDKFSEDYQKYISCGSILL